MAATAFELTSTEDVETSEFYRFSTSRCESLGTLGILSEARRGRRGRGFQPATRPHQKLRGYARGKIPVCWIVSLVDRQVEVYTRP